MDKKSKQTTQGYDPFRNIDMNEFNKLVDRAVRKGRPRKAAERSALRRLNRRNNLNRTKTNTDEQEPHKINLADWKVFVAVSKTGYFEGLIIAPSMPELYKGYFFLFISSAVDFINENTVKNQVLLTEIDKIQSRTDIKFHGKDEVEYITEKKGSPSINNRKMLCIYIEKAIEVKPELPKKSEAKYLSERFQYEDMLDSTELSDFLGQKLYKRKTIVTQPKSPEFPIHPAEFEVDGVKMFGTRFRADLMSFPSDKSCAEYVIPQYVVQIKSGAFNKANHLQAIKIGEGVKYIEREAFVDNISLAAITIPSNVEMVEDGAFTRCSNLRIAIIKSKSEDISPKLFTACKRLEVLATQNEKLRCQIEIMRQSSNSQVELKTHKAGTSNGYPHLAKDEKIVVMGNIYNCLKRNHPINSMWVNVQIRENGVIKDVPICVFRCKRCKKTFILPDIYYYYLMRYDFVNTKLFIRLDYDTWYTGSKMKCLNDPFDSNGVLKSAGYNVNEVEGLSHSTRVRILRDVIKFGILSKAEVEQRLQHFIDYNGASARNELARSKWKEDLIAIHQFNRKL